MSETIYRKIRGFALSAGLAFYVASVAVYLAAPPSLRSIVMNSYGKAFIACGLSQSFEMFAPNPPARDFYVDAQVDFSDGSKTTYAYPRGVPSPWSVGNPYLLWWGLGWNMVRTDMVSRAIRPDYARWVARLLNRETKKIPVLVTLVAHEAISPEPKAFCPRKPLVYGNPETLLVYRVREDDLQ